MVEPMPTARMKVKHVLNVGQFCDIIYILIKTHEELLFKYKIPNLTNLT